jgi:hypothetical protein
MMRFFKKPPVNVSSGVSTTRQSQLLTIDNEAVKL